MEKAKTAIKRSSDAEKYPTGPYSLLEMEGGGIAFAGSVSAEKGGGVEIFRVELNGCPPLWGEFDLDWIDQGPNFNVKIVSFGYRDKYSVGSGDLSARVAISGDQKSLVESMIHVLFSNETRFAYPMHGRGRQFTSRLIFDPGWAVVNRADIFNKATFKRLWGKIF